MMIFFKMTIFIIISLIISVTFFARAQLSSHIYPIHVTEEQHVEVRKTIDLLEEGQRNITLSQRRDLALVLGNTGSGKSTLIQWLFGDNELLNATRIAGGDFIIVDGHRIGDSTVISKTLFPELVMDGSTNTAYYDCPGFSDTRNTSCDIASAYFIKRVADHAKRVKLIFTVNFSSVRKGVDRLDFMKLLTHATDLIKNIDKFGDSIALVVTKVDYLYEHDVDGNPISIPDGSVIKGIAEFLIDVRNALTEDLSNKLKYVKFLNIFLKKNSDGSYARIGIFRRPKSAGPLSKNVALQEGKVHITRILNRITFGGKQSADFGYTVSDRSKNDIIYLIQDIGITVEAHLDKVGNVLLSRFNLWVQNVTKRLTDFVSHEENAGKHNFQPHKMIVDVKNALSLGMRSVSQLGEKVRNVTQPSELSRIVRSSVSKLLLKLDLNINEILEVIANQGQYFDFLQVVSKKTFSIPKSWALNVENKAQDISILNSQFINYANEISENVSTQVDGIFSSVGRLVYEHHEARVERMKNKIDSLLISGNISINNNNKNKLEVAKMRENVDKSVSSSSSLIKNIKTTNNLTLLVEKITKSLEKIPHNNNNNKAMTRKLKKYLQYLQVTISNSKFSEVRKSWAILFEREVGPMANLNRDFEDFISAKLEIVSNRITEILGKTLEILIDYYENLSRQINYVINSYVNASLTSSNPVQMQRLINKLNEGYLQISKLSEESSNLKSPIEMFKNLNSSISDLDINFLDKEMANVSGQINRLYALLRVNNRAFAMPVEWVKLFRNALSNMTELKDNCRRNVSNLKDSVTNSVGQLIEVVGQSIRKYYLNLVREMEFKIELLVNESGEVVSVVVVDPNEARTFRDSLNGGVNITLSLTNYIRGLTDVTGLADKINQSANEMKLGLLVSAEVVGDIERNCAYLNYLLIASNESSMEVKKSWVNGMESAGQFVLGLRKEFDSGAIVSLQEVGGRIEDLIADFTHLLNQNYAEKLNEVRVELASFTLNSTGVEVEVGNFPLNSTVKEVGVENFPLNSTLKEVEKGNFTLSSPDKNVESGNSTLNYSTDKEVELWKAKKMAFTLKNALIIMSNLSSRIQSLSTPLALKSILNDSVILIVNDEFRTSENVIRNVSFQSEILDFVLIAAGVKFKTPNGWLTLVQNASYHFSTSLDDFIKFDVKETGKTIYSLIRNDLEALGRKMMDHYEGEIIIEESHVVLLASLNKARNEISKLLLNKNYAAADLFGQLDDILDCVTELNIDKEIIDRALKKYSYLEYVRALISSENQLLISVNPFHNLESFETALNFLNQSHVWFTFLIELDGKLSQYDIQRDASRYNVANLNDWGQINKAQGISIHKNNFHQFLDKLNVSGDIREAEISDSRLKALENVFAINFRDKYKAICDNRKNVVLRGKFIKFSDFIDVNGAYQNPCHFHSPNLVISASKTIFIDRNFIAIGSQFNVSIEAPKWEVIGGSRSIVLDGKDGQSHYLNRASDGREPGFKGSDGIAGLSGGAAGSFRGTGLTFINGRQLRISANGGRGGRGQHGGHGREGSDGDFVRYDQIAYGSGLENAGWFYIKLALPTDRAQALGLHATCNRNCPNVHGCECVIYGKSGQRGGDGGNGGEGGKGGREGRVDIMEEGPSSWISKSHIPGLAGERGEGGVGGVGGRSKKVRLEYWVNYFVPVVNPPTFKFIEDIYESAENGKPGK